MKALSIILFARKFTSPCLRDVYYCSNAVSSTVFSVSNPTWNDPSCPHEDSDDLGFIVDGHAELYLLDGKLDTCLLTLPGEPSFVRLNVYVYTPMNRKEFILIMWAIDLACDYPGMLIYYEQNATNADQRNLLQCRLDESYPRPAQMGVIPCAFVCTNQYKFGLKTRVIMQLGILPWEIRNSFQPKVCGITIGV